jgi:hypothetical protein
VAQTIDSNFPYIPLISGDPVYAQIVVPDNGENNAPIQIKDWFRLRNLNQPDYDRSRLQPPKDVFDAESELPEDRKADITRVPFVRNVPSYPGTDQESAWNSIFKETWRDQLINKDTRYNRTCFGDDKAQHPDAKEFDGNEAVELAKTFCEDVIKSGDDKTPIPPSVRDTSSFHNASRVYSLTKTSAGSHLGFFAVADPASFLQARNARQFFEGYGDDAKVNHCALTYKDVIHKVRYTTILPHRIPATNYHSATPM